MAACAGAGDAASNAPCYRILDGAPTCVYRPKVQVVDNWGWCNCTGDGCAYTLSNNGAYREGCSLTNPPANAKPWTEYVGEIRLAPRAQDAAAFVPGGGGPGGGGGGGSFDPSVLEQILSGGGMFSL
jgi:hypothetical protein